MRSLKKFHLLDEKVEQTVKKMSQLQAHYSSLHQKNKSLAGEISKLRNENRELIEKIELLKISSERIAGSAINKEEIRKTLDRVLEKFGELQL